MEDDRPGFRAEPETTRELFASFFDDAALFPPAELPMGEALSAHLEHRRSWYHAMVGPFVCTHRRIEELKQSKAGDPGAPLVVSVIVSGGAAAIAGAISSVAEGEGLRLAAVEAAVQSASEAKEVVLAFRRYLPEGVQACVEVPRNKEQAPTLDVLHGYSCRAKLRMGGTEAAAFTTAAEVASFLFGCITRDLVFKCTAGLHHAVRTIAPDSGFRHHGFLNLLAAVDALLEGGGPDSAAGLLADGAGLTVAEAVRHMSTDRISAIRKRFVSVGTCSISEPVADLVALGLVSKR